MSARLAALLAALSLMGCPNFPASGRYACDPNHPRTDECPDGKTYVPLPCEGGADECTALTAPAGVTLTGIYASGAGVFVTGSSGYLAELHQQGWLTGFVEEARGADFVGVGEQGERLVAVTADAGVYLERRAGSTTWTVEGFPEVVTVLGVFSRAGSTWVDVARATGPILLSADGGLEWQSYGGGGDWLDTGAPTDPARTTPVHIRNEQGVVNGYHDRGGSLGNVSWPISEGSSVLSLGTPDSATALVVGAAGHVGLASANWTPVPSTTTEDLQDVFAATADEAWVVGARGTLLRYDPASARISHSALQLTDDLRKGVQTARDELWLLSSTRVFRVKVKR